MVAALSTYWIIYECIWVALATAGLCVWNSHINTRATLLNSNALVCEKTWNLLLIKIFVTWKLGFRRPLAIRTVLHSIPTVFIISLSLQICTGAFNRLYLKPGKPSTAVEKDGKSSLRKERKALARDTSIWKNRYSLWHNVPTIYFYFLLIYFE